MDVGSVIYNEDFTILDTSRVRVQEENHVKPDDTINTEHLMILLVVGLKYFQKDWLAPYMTLSYFVVCS